MRAQGLEYAWRFFVGENVERFATSTYNTWRGYIYVPIIIGGLLPWSAFGLLWARPVSELVSGRHQRLGDALLAAQAAYIEAGARPELLRTYQLLADPALPITRASGGTR